MLGFFKSDMETVRGRIKKPFIIATIFLIALIVFVIVKGDFGRWITHELYEAIVTYFCVGGIWYGRNVIAVAGKAPINENTGEEYYPGGINGSIFRWCFAIALGATVGAVMFLWDAIRVIIAGIKALVESRQAG